jgi:hypothetical protein
MLGTPASNFTLRSAPDQMVSLEQFRNLKQRISLSPSDCPRLVSKAGETATGRTCKGIAEDKVQVVVLMVDIDSVSYSHPCFIVEEDTGGGECPLIKFRGVVYAQK